MSLFSEFKKFAMRGNVVDLAVGVIIGASFTGNVGSYGARRSASSATRISPPRMATGARGASRVSLTIARSAPDVARRDGNRESAGMVAIAYLSDEPEVRLIARGGFSGR